MCVGLLINIVVLVHTASAAEGANRLRRPLVAAPLLLRHMALVTVCVLYAGATVCSAF